MNQMIRALVPIVLVSLLPFMNGCLHDAESGQQRDSDGITASRGEPELAGGEHDRKREGEHERGGEGEHGEEGEESGTELALNESYDHVRNGARLILAYDAETNSFTGTVANTTNETLKRVRVEVHLSNGRELGPTIPADLAPGEKREVQLKATSNNFEGWTAHPEVGEGEHGGREREGEHDREGRSERGEGSSS